MSGIAIVGLGYWGPNLVRNFHALEGEALRVVCDRDARRVAANRKLYPRLDGETSFERLLERDDVGAVVLATPLRTHYELAKQALAAGRHVLIEKPFTATVAQGEELIALARRQGLVLMVDHVFLYHPAVRRMKQIVERGELGDLYFINSVRVNLGQFQHDVNVIWDLAPHDISILDELVGRLPDRVAAFGSAHKRTALEDVAYLNLDFGGGLIAGVHVSWLSPVKVRSIMVGGSQRFLIFNDLDPVEKVKVYDSTVDVREDDLEGRRNLLWDYRAGDVWSPHVDHREALAEVVAHFAACIATGAAPKTDGEAGLRVVRVLTAAQESLAAGGRSVAL